MPYIRIWVHIVFAVKDRQPLLTLGTLKKVIAHIKQNACQKNLWIDCINGYHNHLHILASTKKTFTEGYDEFILKYDFSEVWLKPVSN